MVIQGIPSVKFYNQRFCLCFIMMLMRKPLVAGLVSFVITFVILGGAVFGYIVLTKNDKKPSTSTTGIKSSVEPAKKEFCDIVSPNQLKNISGIIYKKPMNTKSVVTTGLSSQTCAYLSSKPTDSVQIVLKYQTSKDSQPTIEENWEQLKAQNKDNYLKSEVSKNAFITQNTLYIFENKQIITITSGLKMSDQEQIAKLLL